MLACADLETGALVEHVDEGVTLAEVQTCAAPAALSYTESGESWGLRLPENSADQHEESPSIAAGDIDGDGLDDLVIVNSGGLSHHYRASGSGFDVTEISSTIGLNMGILLHDVDGDGDLDLMLGGWEPRVLMNESGVFSHDAPLPVLPSNPVGPAVMAHEFAPGDLDGDGVLEFYMPITYNFENFDDQYNDLVMVGSNSTYAYDEDAVPVDVGMRHGLDALWFDADGDLDQDVYVVNDFGMLQGSSMLLRNEGGVLTAAGESCYCNALFNAKGVDVDDYNGDGRPDIYISANPQNTLYEQLSDGSWVDVSVIANVGAVDTDATGWGGVFLDHDNDGWRDILVAQGDRWNAFVPHPEVDVAIKLLRQDGGLFADVAPELGMTPLGSFRAVSVLDFNLDGVEDLLVTQIEDRPLLYLSDGCTEASWVEIDAPMGSVVRVEAGGRMQTNWVKMDAGYQSHRPARLHFGLGDAAMIDHLTVTLADGTTLGATAIEARRRVTVRP
jgi:enediyne biosynthesis protein E4